MKRIVFSPHALERLVLRGATEAEATTAIQEGERLPARLDRVGFRKNLPFHATWKGRFYETKQVLPIVRETEDAIIVVTVYVYYFGGAQ